MKINPIDESNPTLADIARAVNQVHTCVDRFRAEQSDVNIMASIRHQEITKAVAGLQTQQEMMDGRVTKLAKAFGTEMLEHGEKPEKLNTIAGWKGWQVVGVVFGSMSGFVAFYKIVVPAMLRYGPPFVEALHHAILAAK